MIPGNPNGQVWIASDIRKIEPVARSSKLYPTRVEEAGAIQSSLFSFYIKPTVKRVYYEDACGLSAGISSILIIEGAKPVPQETAVIEVSLNLSIKESPLLVCNEASAVNVSLSFSIIESPKINDVTDSVASVTAAITDITLV
mgnify:CR=1 FL=1